MSYQVLARKWRPRIFAEMAGQQHVLQALINALDNDRLHHAYLFTGTRGVGKTTIARILSKCLNCEAGVSSVPCGECSACNEINEGRFVDLIEVDAASRTGVDDMRDLLDNVQYTPARGRYKIYLIDEVHMLTKNSFAALLKTLEEPPPHVKFLFATTDPQKLPITVLSRCLQFNLKNLSPERITEHLQFVLGEEKVPFEEAGLWSLARAADGSMRDALSLTDQAIGHGGGQVNEADVSSMLGTIERSYVIDICKALSSGSGPEILASIARMAEQAPDYDMALADVLSIWHQVAIVQTVPEALDKGLANYSEVLALSAQVSREDVQLFYQICLLGRKDLQLSADAKSGFEMVMLRALAFRPQNSPRGPALGSSGQTAAVALVTPASETNKATPVPPEVEPSVKKSEAQVAEDRPPWEPEVAPQKPLANVEPLVSEEPSAFPNKEPSADKEPSASPNKEEPSASPINEAIPLQDFSPDNWIELRKQLSIVASLGEIASHCLYLGRSGTALRFLIDSGHNSLYDDPHQEQFSEALSDYFKTPVTVEISLGVAQQETPRAANLREKSERLAEAVETLNNDPAVVKFKQLFDGGVDERSVQPID
ncbi:MAG: DNA polymerase III subunit gamma/tau [Porticoccaceae bacterium]|nr:DNA polymerase III subunit gamma/tau [Porticoccaceae bacterium]